MRIVFLSLILILCVGYESDQTTKYQMVAFLSPFVGLFLCRILSYLDKDLMKGFINE